MLFQAGAIDQQALLEAFEYPNAEEIMRRMGEVARAQQEAQMQAQQAEIEQQTQIEQAKMQTQAQIKGMEVQARLAEKMIPQGVPPGTMPQGVPQGQGPPDIASQLDRIRQIVPELANASDEQIMEILAKIQVPQGA